VFDTAGFHIHLPTVRRVNRTRRPFFLRWETVRFGAQFVPCKGFSSPVRLVRFWVRFVRWEVAGPTVREFDGESPEELRRLPEK